jgi:hypothetical protein
MQVKNAPRKPKKASTQFFNVKIQQMGLDVEAETKSNKQHDWGL